MRKTFTGYIDKNGKRIYRGDTLKYSMSSAWDSEVPVSVSLKVIKICNEWFTDDNEYGMYLKDFRKHSGKISAEKVA